MAKAIVDLKANPPKAIPNLTQDAMLYYIENYGTNEDIDWYVELCIESKTEKKNNKGELVEGLDISKVRKEFAKRFFPSLLEEKKAKSKPQSYMDKVLALKNKKK